MLSAKPEGQASAGASKVGLPKPNAVELQFRPSAADAVARFAKPLAPQDRMGVPERDQFAEETQKVRFLFHRIPVHPGVDAIVAITVIVTPLRPPDFVSHEQHRNPLAEQQEGHCIFHLTMPQDVHRGIVRFSFMAAVPAVIVVAAVVVPLTVGFIVLVVVGNKIVKREPIVAGDEVQCWPLALGANTNPENLAFWRRVRRRGLRRL